jgi:hypothetical protein
MEKRDSKGCNGIPPPHTTIGINEILLVEDGEGGGEGGRGRAWLRPVSQLYSASYSVLYTAEPRGLGSSLSPSLHSRQLSSSRQLFTTLLHEHLFYRKEESASV